MSKERLRMVKDDAWFLPIGHPHRSHHILDLVEYFRDREFTLEEVVERLGFKLTRVSSSYDPDFGDGKECACGHTYERHFDTYDNMAPVGCKYCDCYEWHSGVMERVENDTNS